MTRYRYRAHILPDWLKDTLAVGGMLLIVGTFGFLAIVGYALQQGLAP